MVISAANNLNNKKQQLNDLNVFPVPDGDTGTNMSLTMAAAKSALAENEYDSLEEVSAAAANSLIRGARGNSGVILSLLFRGISKGFKGKKEADALTFAYACNLGVEAAYKAVMKPTEGTILTVSRMAASAAIDTATGNNEIMPVFESLIKEGQAALDMTPDILPVLKQAGVVDAGGQGFMVVFEGMYHVLKTGSIIEAKEIAESAPKADFEKFDTESINFAYCTEFIIDKSDINIEADDFRSYLHTIGDCVVVVDAGDFIKTHVHTNNPGLALEAAVKIGSLTKIKIENMKEQHTALSEDMLQAAANQEAKAKKEQIAAPEKKYGFVAVAAGEGFASIFKDLGADNIIEGGQTMNPSTEDILEAVNATPSEIVFVLPNNKNIIMAAQAATELSEKEIIVIPTKTVPQGITAMFSFDPDSDEDYNENIMSESCGLVKTLSVTYAARDSVFDGMEIKKGQYLGLYEGKVNSVTESLSECVDALCTNLSGDEGIVTVYYGADANENEAESVKSIIENKVKDADITVIGGGQPVYYYVISVE